VRLFLDSFWRALAYLVIPRVIMLSLLPLLLSAGLAVAAAVFFWTPAVDGVRATLESWSLVNSALLWLETNANPSFRLAVAPIIVVVLALPVVVLTSLLAVALLMTPAVVRLVARRRFPALSASEGASFWQGALWSLGCTVVALLALAISSPLWLIPPLVLLIPPLIWGWLTAKVFAFDVLSLHAGSAERKAVLEEHRWPLLLMGIICGYLGAAPSLIWVFGFLTFVLAPVLVAVSVWLYTLVFAFSALWFAHYGLAALKHHRDGTGSTALTMTPADRAEPVLAAEAAEVEPTPLPAATAPHPAEPGDGPPFR